jgi:membrane protease YdiL (CAAX protease family)
LGLDKTILWAVFDIGTYLFTGLLIWAERKELNDFNIDTLSLLVLILFKPIECFLLKYLWHMKSFMSIDQIGGITITILSIIYLIMLFIFRKQFKLTIKWKSIYRLGWGVLFGIIAVLILSVPMSFQVRKMGINSALHNLFNPTTFVLIFYQISYAAASEEPLFRGFIWGYLRKQKISELLILLIQMTLFTLGHLYYLKTNPISFFVIIPIASIFLGLSIIKSKSIASSMLTHGILNGVTNQAGILLLSIR